MKYKDGSVYTGDWIEGNRHGQGKRIFSDGMIYEGDWKDDKGTGKG